MEDPDQVWGDSGWKALLPFYGDYALARVSCPHAAVPVLYALSGAVAAALCVIEEILFDHMPTIGSDATALMFSCIDAGIYLLAAVYAVSFAVAMHRLSRSFGHGPACAACLVLFHPIAVYVIGYGDDGAGPRQRPCAARRMRAARAPRVRRAGA